MESTQLNIEEKKLAIAQKKAELSILEAELNVLLVKQDIAEGKKPRLQEEDEKKKYYYVVTNGPKFGIHEDYMKISDLPKNYYVQANSKFEAEHILQSARKKKEQLGENIFQVRQATKINLHEMDSRLINKTLTKDEWVNLANKAKRMSFEDQAIPIIRDKDLAFHMILMTGCQKELVADLFNAGLVDTIYPSLRAEEMMFQPALHKALMIYLEKSKMIAQQRNVFIRVFSSYPDWEDGKTFPGYHLLKVGPAGFFQNPEPRQIENHIPSLEDMAFMRSELIHRIQKELEAINKDSKVKINYDNGHVILISRFNKSISESDFQRILKWRENLSNQKVKVGNLTRKFLTIEDMDHDSTGTDLEDLDNKNPAEGNKM